MDIQYFYENNQHSYKHEIIITSLVNLLEKVIELPKTLEVCLYQLDKNVYGGIDRYVLNRIGINYDVPFDMLPVILTHELIHVHQKHTGILRITQNGTCYWHGIPYANKPLETLSFDEYLKLPWEIDAISKQEKVLITALKLVDTN